MDEMMVVVVPGSLVLPTSKLGAGEPREMVQVESWGFPPGCPLGTVDRTLGFV